MTQSNKSLVNMVGVAVVAILIAAVFVLPGCGGSPTEPKPDPTPVPTPTPTPRPAQTFTFTLSATEVTPKEVTAWPGDTIKFVTTDPVGHHQISGNSGQLTGPVMRPASEGGPTEWTTTPLLDYGAVKELTFYDKDGADHAYDGKIHLMTKF